MDSCKEQLVKIKTTVSVVVSKCVIWAFSALIAIICLYAAVRIFPAFILLSAGILYLSFKLTSSLNIEYEYIATNGSVDIDKIINKSSRKKVVSFECSSVSKVCKFTSDYKKKPNEKTYICTDDFDDSYVFSVNSQNKGKFNVVLSPDNDFKNSIKIFIPRSLITDWWK